MLDLVQLSRDSVSAHALSQLARKHKHAGRIHVVAAGPSALQFEDQCEACDIVILVNGAVVPFGWLGDYHVMLESTIHLCAPWLVTSTPFTGLTIMEATAAVHLPQRVVSSLPDWYWYNMIWAHRALWGKQLSSLHDADAGLCCVTDHDTPKGTTALGAIHLAFMLGGESADVHTWGLELCWQRGHRQHCYADDPYNEQQTDGELAIVETADGRITTRFFYESADAISLVLSEAKLAITDHSQGLLTGKAGVISENVV